MNCVVYIFLEATSVFVFCRLCPTYLWLMEKSQSQTKDGARHRFFVLYRQSGNGPVDAVSVAPFISVLLSRVI